MPCVRHERISWLPSYTVTPSPPGSRGKDNAQSLRLLPEVDVPALVRKREIAAAKILLLKKNAFEGDGLAGGGIHTAAAEQAGGAGDAERQFVRALVDDFRSGQGDLIRETVRQSAARRFQRPVLKIQNLRAGLIVVFGTDGRYFIGETCRIQF